MASKQEMPTVNMNTEYVKMTQTDQHFIKKIEKMNLDRAKGAKSLRGKNIMVGAFLGVAVFSIYTYAITAVKQEKFLDFEEMPEEKK